MNQSRKIKPTISGQYIFNIITKESKLMEFENILELFKQNLKFLRKKTGAYIFSGGIISNLDLIENSNGSITASIRFNKAKPFFLDNLTSATLPNSNNNSLSCSMKGNFDFDRIKSYLKEGSDWFEETKKCFSAKKSYDKRKVKVTAYPSMAILNLMCEFNDKEGALDPNSPGRIIKNLSKVGGGTT
jgi:hypothetical protein